MRSGDEMSREIWVDGHLADSLPKRCAMERLHYAQKMAVRHRGDAKMHPFWTGALERLKEQRGKAAEKNSNTEA